MPTTRISARVSAISESATLAVDAKAKALKAAGRPVIGFGAGEPDFPTPAHIVEAAVQAVQPGQLAVEVGQPAGDRLRLLLVFPQPGLARTLPQHVGFFPHGLRVEDGLNAGELRR